MDMQKSDRHKKTGNGSFHQTVYTIWQMVNKKMAVQCGFWIEHTMVLYWCVPYVEPARKERRRKKLEKFWCGLPANFSNMSYKIRSCWCVCDKFNRFILAMEFRLQCENWKRGNKKNERHDKDKGKQFHIESYNTFSHISYEANMVFLLAALSCRLLFVILLLWLLLCTQFPYHTSNLSSGEFGEWRTQNI